MNRNAFKKEIQEISKMSELPEHLRDIIVQNKIMNKRIIILEAEIQEKNSVIQQLKQQLDCTVIEQTQNKLTIMRNIEDQIEQRTKDIKQKFFDKNMQMQGEIEGLREEVSELKIQIGKQQQKCAFYIQKIDSLKQYIIDVIEEKDYLISELSSIINEQQKKIKSCSFCSKSVSEVCNQFHTQQQKFRKKTPYIAKNV